MCEQAGMWARLGGGKGRRARATNLAKMRSVARWTWVAMDAAGSIGMILKAASAAAVAVEAMAGKQVAVRVEAVVRSGRMARAAANEATVAADRAGRWASSGGRGCEDGGHGGQFRRRWWSDPAASGAAWCNWWVWVGRGRDDGHFGEYGLRSTAAGGVWVPSGGHNDRAMQVRYAGDGGEEWGGYGWR